MELTDVAGNHVLEAAKVNKSLVSIELYESGISDELWGQINDALKR